MSDKPEPDYERIWKELEPTMARFMTTLKDGPLSTRFNFYSFPYYSLGPGFSQREPSLSMSSAYTPEQTRAATFLMYEALQKAGVPLEFVNKDGSRTPLKNPPDTFDPAMFLQTPADRAAETAALELMRDFRETQTDMLKKIIVLTGNNDGLSEHIKPIHKDPRPK